MVNHISNGRHLRNSIKVEKEPAVNMEELDSSIGYNCIIAKGTEFGRHTHIGNYVEIEEGVAIGDHVTIQGRNRIGKNCVIKDHVTIKYGAILTEEVTVFENAFIGVNAVTLGSDTDREQIKGTFIGANCYIGGGAMIAPGLEIPSGTIIGAQSYVREVDGKGTYVGTPAKKIK